MVVFILWIRYRNLTCDVFRLSHLYVYVIKHIHVNKMPVFDNIRGVFFLAKMLEQNPNIQLTFDEYQKYLNIWNNSLDDATREMYTIYSSCLEKNSLCSN